MKTLLLLPLQFMKRNKGQTISILLSIVLSAAVMISVCCLMYSAHVNKTESIREQYGDYHYYLLGSKALYQKIIDKQSTAEYDVQNIQMLEIKDYFDIDDDANIVLSFADSGCRSMINRDIVEGEYPTNVTEIALDRYTLRSLGVDDVIGTNVNIAGRDFLLSGIVQDSVTHKGNTMEGYVCIDYPSKSDLGMIYLKFNERHNFYGQVVSFADVCEIEEDALESNGELIDCVIESNTARMINTIKTVIMDEESNFITLLMKLESDFHMTSGLVSFVLVIFSSLVIYSIFSVSISKRLKEYSILQTIGISSKTICIMLMIEMSFMMLIGYPIGTILGIFLDKLLFKKVSNLFSGTASLIVNTHTGVAGNAFYEMDNSKNEMFLIDKKAIVLCAILMLFLTAIICLIISAKVEKSTIIEMMKGEKKHYKNAIYSVKKKSLVNVLTNRFMFAVPSKFIRLVLTLSVGNVLIITTNFIATNTRINNEMVMHSQEGVSSDVKAFVGKNERFDYGITSDQCKQLGDLNGIESVSGFQYNLGEVTIGKERLAWKDFWPEIANDKNWKQAPEIMERFNGIVTENEKNYKIKTNIYGYDDESLDLLKDYVLDGEINKEAMAQENGIILRTIIDAQNNHDGLDIKVGDLITVKTLKDLNGDKNLLQFLGDEDFYQEKEFKVMAVISGSIITNTEYIGADGLDIIMTREQMQENYLIDKYNILVINKVKKNDANVVSQIQKVLSDVNDINIIDNSLSIKAKNDEVRRAETVLYGISLLLMIIAVFNIINTIFHLLDEKRYSLAVLRAIGITETDFYKLLLLQSLKYAFTTLVVMYAIYFGIIQRTVRNMLIHVYGYINHIQSVSMGMLMIVSVSDVIIFMLTVSVIAKQILRFNIINELKVRE